MLKQEQHKRFKKTAMNEMTSLCNGYWYAHTPSSIAPSGNEIDEKYKRPSFIYT